MKYVCRKVFCEEQKLAEEQNKWKHNKWTPTTWEDTFRGHFRGHLRGTFRVILCGESWRAENRQSTLKLFLHTHTHARAHTHTHTQIRARAHTHVHRARAHTHTHTHTHIYTHIHPRAHTHTYAPARTHTHTHTQKPARTHTHTYIHTRVHTHTYTHTHTHPHTHTHTHTHRAHTHTHTHSLATLMLSGPRLLQRLHHHGPLRHKPTFWRPQGHWRVTLLATQESRGAEHRGWHAREGSLKIAMAKSGQGWLSMCTAPKSSSIILPVNDLEGTSFSFQDKNPDNGPQLPESRNERVLFRTSWIVSFFLARCSLQIWGRKQVEYVAKFRCVFHPCQWNILRGFRSRGFCKQHWSQILPNRARFLKASTAAAMCRISAICLAEHHPIAFLKVLVHTKHPSSLYVYRYTFLLCVKKTGPKEWVSRVSNWLCLILDVSGGVCKFTNNV